MQPYNILGFDNYEKVLAVHKANEFQGQVGSNVDSGSESDLGPASAPAFIPAPRPGFGKGPYSTSPDTDFNFPTTACPDSFSQSNPIPNILLDFYNSDSNSDTKRTRKDILLDFYSDRNSVDEDTEDPETGTEGEELDSSAHAVGMARKLGEKYTEFDFGFLNEKGLEITDDANLDEISSSGSTD